MAEKLGFAERMAGWLGLGNGSQKALPPPADEDVVDAEFEELDHPVTGPGGKVLYTAEVVSVKDGYCFLRNVKKGYSTVPTKGDVFCPMSFPVGAIVQFDELNEDHERPGKFRTEMATLEVGPLAEVKPENGGKAVALMQLMRRRPYHATAKEVDPEEVRKAAENLPFVELLKLYQRIPKNGVPEKNMDQVAEAFLLDHFPALREFGVSFETNGDIEDEKEAAMIKDTCEEYASCGMGGMANTIPQTYAKFVQTRGAFRFMKAAGIFGIESIVPAKHLPELLCMFPVWYAGSEIHGLKSQTGTDGSVQRTLFHMLPCSMVNTQVFCDFFQAYNYRMRSLEEFKGDLMPPRLMKIMPKALKAFDLVAILTPYLTEATKEWANRRWPQNIDPLMVGFIQGLDYVFVLGRWSDEGIFPLMCDLIADTMSHLAINKDFLKNIPENTSWLHTNNSAGSLSAWRNRGDSREHPLVTMANKVLQAYEEKKLFEFLRGEWSPELELETVH